MGASVHTVEVSYETVDDRVRRVMKAGPHRGETTLNGVYFDVATVRFDDHGGMVNPGDLAAAQSAIVHARGNPAGAIVVLFIHGWHHSAAWDPESGSGDAHFKSFRDTLAFIAAREAERYFPDPGAGQRRVVGLYVGWNGDPVDSWLARYARDMTFWDRYQTARRIGGARDARRLIRAVVESTKGPLAGSLVESPLVLMGHSMGALILQSAFLALLKDPEKPLERPASARREVVDVQRAGNRIAFPDVLIALNSAADSAIHKEIRQVLNEQRFKKTVTGGNGIRYDAPLLISVTSTGDQATKLIWRAANLLRPTHVTDGHDSRLFTHDLKIGTENVACEPKQTPQEYGQNWHCLRPPEPPGVATPRISVDLPLTDRGRLSDKPKFLRHTLTPLADMAHPRLTWVFQIPPGIVKDHNDIFNPRASSLQMALIQISGAVMSLAPDWERTFEPL